MPATDGGMSRSDYVLGVDGCRAGWIYAVRFPVSGEFHVAIADSVTSVLDGPGKGAKSGMIDIPIGLAERGRRRCEIEARRLIGARRSSVFPSPTRGMLDFHTYEEANAYGKENGAGLSRQSWAIIPKIREVDRAMTPLLQATFCEGHPEVAFTRLIGSPCASSKRTKDGIRERSNALRRAGLQALDEAFEQVRRRYPRQSDFAIDDFLDACVLTVSAEARLRGEDWRTGGGERDAKGLLMEICG